MLSLGLGTYRTTLRRLRTLGTNSGNQGLLGCSGHKFVPSTEYLWHQVSHNVPAYIAMWKWCVLKVTPQVATLGAESVVYDCFVQRKNCRETESRTSELGRRASTVAPVQEFSRWGRQERSADNFCICQSSTTHTGLTNTQRITHHRSFRHFVCMANTHTNTHTRLTALSPGPPRWAGTRKAKPIWSKRQWVAVASAGTYASCTSLQTDNHANTPPLKFFTGRMPFLPPNQQSQSTEGTALKAQIAKWTIFKQVAGRINKLASPAGLWLHRPRQPPCWQCRTKLNKQMGEQPTVHHQQRLERSHVWTLWKLNNFLPKVLRKVLSVVPWLLWQKQLSKVLVFSLDCWPPVNLIVILQLTMGAVHQILTKSARLRGLDRNARRAGFRPASCTLDTPTLSDAPIRQSPMHQLNHPLVQYHSQQSKCNRRRVWQFITSDSSLRCPGMARLNKASHRFTCQSHVYP